MKSRRLEPFWRPTAAQIAVAHDKRVKDVIGARLRVLFVGINPGLYTAAIGHHFGRPGNRFWPALHAGGFTPRLLSPFEECELLEYRLGITNMIERATARADELTREELRRSAARLKAKVERHRPRFVAILGLTSYRTAFSQPKAVLGRQSERLAEAALWLLPNPSGLNAHYQPATLARLFRELREAVERDERT
jgi:TDG/mug DNA glycosylase family protein